MMLIWEYNVTMINILVSLKLYLKQVLGIETNDPKTINISSIPFLLIDTYDFYEIELLSENLLLIVPKEGIKITPGVLNKHVEIIKKITGKHIVFLDSDITTYDRRQLIGYKISFIIPGNQLYMPELKLDLREYFYRQKQKIKFLTPAAQAVILYILNNKVQSSFTATYLSEKMGYSCMTMSRAITEVAQTQLAKIEKKGKERYVCFEKNKKKLWNKCIPLMRSPVKYELYLNELPERLKFFTAGLTGLSEYSMLAAPLQKTYAIDFDSWAKYKSENNVTAFYHGETTYKLQIWVYSPELFAYKGIVDRFSLYLSLKDSSDERVQKSLNYMMENIKW